MGLRRTKGRSAGEGYIGSEGTEELLEMSDRQEVKSGLERRLPVGGRICVEFLSDTWPAKEGSNVNRGKHTQGMGWREYRKKKA